MFDSMPNKNGMGAPQKSTKALGSSGTYTAARRSGQTNPTRTSPTALSEARHLECKMTRRSSSRASTSSTTFSGRSRSKIRRTGTSNMGNWFGAGRRTITDGPAEAGKAKLTVKPGGGSGVSDMKFTTMRSLLRFAWRKRRPAQRAKE
eukprot:CAMPEP_0115388796 /NCGR_PEP_ID=MMETSP0271-20121206/9361_1 /TAXON_ID=71861 /ORGANISM="Scrippsiella trochoidea, Strain CCMP3099" /LENGTH=147 /DNA_ID=CAMNT_0002812299 /DNA_START=293 /DNA_END=736 /DNA_ORIENTATION=-